MARTFFKNWYNWKKTYFEKFLFGEIFSWRNISNVWELYMVGDVNYLVNCQRNFWKVYLKLNPDCAEGDTRKTLVFRLHCAGENRPYSYSRYWIGTSLKLRLMRGSLFKCKWHLSLFNDIPPHEPPLQASSRPIPRIRIWPIGNATMNNHWSLGISAWENSGSEITLIIVFETLHFQNTLLWLLLITFSFTT